MPLSSEENLLNLKYDFLRRSVISYYARCMKEEDDNNFSVPCDIEQLLSFVKEIFFSYLQEDYKGIIKK